MPADRAAPFDSDVERIEAEKLDRAPSPAAVSGEPEALERMAAKAAWMLDNGATNENADLCREVIAYRAALARAPSAPPLEELAEMILAEFGEIRTKHIGWAWEEISMSREAHKGGIRGWAHDFAGRALAARVTQPAPGADEGPGEGWTREVNWRRSVECRCGYMAWEYWPPTDGRLICTKCGAGKRARDGSAGGGETP